MQKYSHKIHYTLYISFNKIKIDKIAFASDVYS